MSWFKLNFPADLTTEAVADVVRVLAAESRDSLRSSPPPVSFETRLSRSAVSWWLAADSSKARRLETAAEASLPGLSWTEATPPTLALGQAIELRIDSPERLLALDHVPTVVARLLSVGRELRRDEVLVIQWQVGVWLHRSPIPPTRASVQPRSLWNLPDWNRPLRDSEQAQAARRKQEEHVFAVAGRIAVSGATGRRGHELLAAVLHAYQLLRSPGVGPSRRLLPAAWVRYRLRAPKVPRLSPAIRLSAGELAGVIGWPVGNPRLPGVRYALAPRLPLDRRSLLRTATPTDRVVGQSGFPGQRGALAVLRPADAVRHLHVLGPTGSGKSVLAARLILSDLVAGRCVVLVDPKGDLVYDVLVRLPGRLRDRVAVLDPSDPAPAGFNPLASPHGIDSLLHVLHSLWASSWGPRMADIIHAGLLTLARSPGHTLPELPLLLSDPAFRRPLVGQAVRADPLGLGTFWPGYEALSEEARSQALAPVMNRLRSFLLRPELRAVLGQANPQLDLTAVMQGQLSLLVRLPKGELGDASALLGSLLVASLWQLGQGRAAVPEHRRKPVFIYLDEVQEVLRLPLDVADALVQARGLRISLTLLHQHLGQLDPAMRSALLGNAGSRVSFRLDYDDAAAMARRTGELRPEALMGLGAFEAYASLMVENEATPYGSLRTMPLDEPRFPLGPVLAANRRRFGVPADQTEARLRRLIEGEPGAAPTSAIGGRPRPPETRS